jgi:glycylpeptide N-tetradecanoyltransferase
MQDPETHRITDFMSFYSLPSLIMKHAKHKDLGTAYLFYYATDAALSSSSSQGGEEKAKERLSKRLNSLVNDCLIVAKDVSLREMRCRRRQNTVTNGSFTRPASTSSTP